MNMNPYPLAQSNYTDSACQCNHKLEANTLMTVVGLGVGLPLFLSAIGAILFMLMT